MRWFGKRVSTQENEKDDVMEGEVWPPPPAFQPTPVPDKLLNRLTGLPSVCLSGTGLFCTILGCSGPSQSGLSGGAFVEAFEADENLMVWLIAGFLLASLGFLAGAVFSPRSRNGKIGMGLALATGVWLVIRRDHY